ncbi:5-formyltetrahydrofolate cyclo-ligase [hydrothermal vent metagenome]|uniref:5-formyltetrahydrofolate cyclo-ligase n=1 Tax=hydrothermal vent metagenome TaxID=652676 RepID=A0A1W1D594_9ZZZZ
MTLTKTTFRKNCLQKMKKLSNHNKLYRDKRVNQKLKSILKKIKNKEVLFYYPLGFEVDILDVLYFLRKSNKIYIPFMQSQSFKMVPFRLPLYKKKFGIFESGNTLRNIKKIDIAIVPVIGVDKNFQRVGFGKGMYDRFFATLRKKPYTIFIQPQLCYTRENICDDYDVSCDLLLALDGTKTIIKNRDGDVIRSTII